MVNPIAITTRADAVTWEEAAAIAAAMGGRLYRDIRPDPFTSPINLALTAAGVDLGSAERNSTYWFGAVWSGTAWTWPDGTPVPARYFDDQDPNSDDFIGNEIDSVALTQDGLYWINGGDARNGLIVEFTDSKSIAGTGYSEIFFGGAGIGEVLRAGGGDDQFYGPGGGKLLMGAGDDYVQLGSSEPVTPWTNRDAAPGTIVYDGAGADVVVSNPSSGVLHAAIDGDADLFAGLARVSYGDDVAGFHIDDGAYVFGAMGEDVLEFVSEVVGGAGDDQIEGFARIQGGGGDDLLRPGGYLYGAESVLAAYADGGAGDDALFTTPLARAELRGGTGDDTLILADAATVSGGAGADVFIFTAIAPVIINDLAAGDLIDLTALLPGIEDPFAGGYLKTSLSKGYTYVAIDLDGGADALQPFFSLKGAYGALDDFLA